MSSESIGPPPDNQAPDNKKNDTNNGTEILSGGLITKEHGQHAQSANDAPKQKPHKRDWLDKANLIVLILAFIAAAAAACEADRLANLTKRAIDDADVAANTQHADTLLALQKAEAANTLAEKTADRQSRDTASSLALSKEAADATVAALDISRAQIRAYFSCSLWARVDPDNRQRVKYICKNTGQSQARKVTVTITFGYRDLVTGRLIPAKHPGIYFVGDLSQGETDSRDGASISPLPSEILIPGRGAHSVKCTVDFTDIFNVRQTQDFEAWNIADAMPNHEDFRLLVEHPSVVP